jgi:hypothetical protein
MRMNQRAMRSWHSTQMRLSGSTLCCSVKSFATMRYLRKQVNMHRYTVSERTTGVIRNV